MFDPMADLSDDGTTSDPIAPSPQSNAPSSDGGDGGYTPRSGGRGGGGGQYGQEVHSITIHARQRTFYIDLKESSNGKFFKVSEKSRGGRKTTIMFDAEDLDEFIKAFQEMKSKV